MAWCCPTSGASMSEARTVSVITGAARGIGRAAAVRLAQGGHEVVLVDIDGDEAEAAASVIGAEGGRASAVHCDVSDHAATADAVELILARCGRIDVLVNNAGRTMGKGLLEITEEEWDGTIAVNLKSVFNWCRWVAPAMQAAGAGRIINISSLNALNGGVTSAVSKVAYAASKAGVLGLTRSLAKELGPQITVNAICPGIIRTELTDQLLAEREAELTRGISLGRLGTVDDIAGLIAYLASEPHMFMTGQHITADGGQWVS